VPVTYTTSVNCTVTVIAVPALYEPLPVVAAPLTTVGAVESMTRALFAPRELGVPGHARSKAAFSVPVAVSTIEAPASAIAVIDC
jgi:hypothetical protein